MKQYLLIIRGGEDIANQKSPEEMQAHMQDWQKWMESIAQKGNLVGGEPLMQEGKSIIESGTKVIDRPLMEGKELVGGYLMFQAGSLEEATALAKDCPGFEHDCTIEVRQIMPMG